MLPKPQHNINLHLDISLFTPVVSPQREVTIKSDVFVWPVLLF